MWPLSHELPSVGNGDYNRGLEIERVSPLHTKTMQRLGEDKSPNKRGC